MKTTPHLKLTTIHWQEGSIRCSPFRRVILFVALLLICFALSQTGQAVSPPPDGGYPGANTAEGQNALLNLTTGTGNTAVGWYSLQGVSDGTFNTGVGAGTLALNFFGVSNTAVGAGALFLNSGGVANTATGTFALLNNDGSNNTAVGDIALFNNTVGANNSALGQGALYSNIDGFGNTAIGFETLQTNKHASDNTAVGLSALLVNDITGNGLGVSNCAFGTGALADNTDGASNCAFGWNALFQNATGSNNIAVGYLAGQNLTTGDNNIYIGNDGVADESGTIRVGTQGTHTQIFVAGISGVTVTGDPVLVSSSGQLGVATSSARFKDEIKPMDKASKSILALKPVTFRYKKQFDPKGAPQFGLVAEQVEKVNPDLVTRDPDGKAFTVRYEAVNAMLLNEFLKEHRQVQEQQKEIDVLRAELKEQRALIRKVSARVELQTAPAQTVANSKGPSQLSPTPR
jgi:hypothetical protein